MADKAAETTAVQAAPPEETLQLDPLLAASLSPEALKQRQALLDDWAQFVATSDITFGGVLAFRDGDPVPASNARRWQYEQQGLVAKRSSKEGKAAIERAAPVTPATIRAPGDPKD